MYLFYIHLRLTKMTLSLFVLHVIIIYHNEQWKIYTEKNEDKEIEIDY